MIPVSKNSAQDAGLLKLVNVILCAFRILYVHCMSCVCAQMVFDGIMHENIEFSKFKAGVCNAAPLTQQTTPLTT